MLAPSRICPRHFQKVCKKKTSVRQRDERNSRGTTLLSQANAPNAWLAFALTHSRYTSLRTREFHPVPVDVSLSGNGEVPAGSTASSASGSGVMFDALSRSSFTCPGLSLREHAVYLLPRCLQVFFYITREFYF